MSLQNGHLLTQPGRTGSEATSLQNRKRDSAIRAKPLRQSGLLEATPRHSGREPVGPCNTRSAGTLGAAMSCHGSCCTLPIAARSANHVRGDGFDVLC